MGSVVGAITGSTGVGKKAQRGYQEAGDQAQYKPWNVTGSYFGDADFDYEENTASYNLSPELKQLRDLFMNQALKGPDEAGIAEGQAIKDKGLEVGDSASVKLWAAKDPTKLQDALILAEDELDADDGVNDIYACLEDAGWVK